MVLDVQGTVVSTVKNETVAAIKSENGRRYRYGAGTYPVHLEPDDIVTGALPDSQPQLLSEPLIHVSGHPLKRETQVFASIGKTGNVLSAYPLVFLNDYVGDEEVWKSIERGVQSLRFRPATFKGRPITAGLVFTVRLVPK